MEDKKQLLSLEDREKLSISGVIDVDNFNEKEVTLDTNLGYLTINGDDLKINKLNVDSGELVIEGYVISLTYSNNNSNKGGFFGKLFR